MNKRKNRNNESYYHKIIMFVVSGILFPFVLRIFKFKFFGLSEELSFIIYVIIGTILALLIAYVVDIIKRRKSYFEEANEAITKVSKKYRVPSSESYYQLFELAHDNVKIQELESRYSSVAREKSKRKDRKVNYIYYALSAKKYLNWIDYLYFKYLKKLKDQLSCTIYIFLHFPDYIKECKVTKGKDADPNIYVNEYKKVCEYFSEFIYKIIGKDNIIIRTEEEFYKGKIRKYYDDFHNIYISSTLYFANCIDNKDFKYSNFKRRLSHILSSFPIWMIAQKTRNDRIYILDNQYSLEVWDMEPFKEIRKNNDIYFIYANSLKYSNGERINVHDINYTINFSDTLDVIKDKLSKLTNEDKKVMIYMLREEILKNDIFYEISNTDLDKLLYDTIISIINECKFIDNVVI